jgi:hypothetical protein
VGAPPGIPPALIRPRRLGPFIVAPPPLVLGSADFQGAFPCVSEGSTPPFLCYFMEELLSPKGWMVH